MGLIDFSILQNSNVNKFDLEKDHTPSWSEELDLENSWVIEENRRDNKAGFKNLQGSQLSLGNFSVLQLLLANMEPAYSRYLDTYQKRWLKELKNGISCFEKEFFEYKRTSDLSVHLKKILNYLKESLNSSIRRADCSVNGSFLNLENPIYCGVIWSSSLCNKSVSTLHLNELIKRFKCLLNYLDEIISGMNLVIGLEKTLTMENDIKKILESFTSSFDELFRKFLQALKEMKKNKDVCKYDLDSPSLYEGLYNQWSLELRFLEELDVWRHSNIQRFQEMKGIFIDLLIDFIFVALVSFSDPKVSLDNLSGHEFFNWTVCMEGKLLVDFNNLKTLYEAHRTHDPPRKQKNSSHNVPNYRLEMVFRSLKESLKAVYRSVSDIHHTSRADQQVFETKVRLMEKRTKVFNMHMERYATLISKSSRNNDDTDGESFSGPSTSSAVVPEDNPSDDNSEELPQVHNPEDEVYVLSEGSDTEVVNLELYDEVYEVGPGASNQLVLEQNINEETGEETYTAYNYVLCELRQALAPVQDEMNRREDRAFTRAYGKRKRSSDEIIHVEDSEDEGEGTAQVPTQGIEVGNETLTPSVFRSELKAKLKRLSVNKSKATNCTDSSSSEEELE